MTLAIKLQTAGIGVGGLVVYFAGNYINIEAACREVSTVTGSTWENYKNSWVPVHFSMLFQKKLTRVGHITICLNNDTPCSFGLSWLDAEAGYPRGAGSYTLKAAELYCVNHVEGLYVWKW